MLEFASLPKPLGLGSAAPFPIAAAPIPGVAAAFPGDAAPFPPAQILRQPFLHLSSSPSVGIAIAGHATGDEHFLIVPEIDWILPMRNPVSSAECAVPTECRLSPAPTTDIIEVVARVTRTGGFLVHGIFYSAPSHLTGERLCVHVYDDRIEAWLGSTPVVSHPPCRHARTRAGPTASTTTTSSTPCVASRRLPCRGALLNSPDQTDTSKNLASAALS
jgi:hypothetical protein